MVSDVLSGFLLNFILGTSVTGNYSLKILIASPHAWLLGSNHDLASCSSITTWATSAHSDFSPLVLLYLITLCFFPTNLMNDGTFSRV